jgi:hypothetical protein
LTDTFHTGTSCDDLTVQSRALCNQVFSNLNSDMNTRIGQHSRRPVAHVAQDRNADMR